MTHSLPAVPDTSVKGQVPWIRYGVPLLCYVLFGIYTLIWTRSAFGYGWDFFIYYDKSLAAQAGQSAYFPYLVSVSFLYHPSVLSFLSLLTWMNRDIAFALWLVASVLAYSTSLYLLWRLCGSRFSKDRLILLVLFFGFGPLWETLYLGQINPFVVLSLTLCLYWSEQKRHIPAGIMLGLAILLKTSPVLFLLYFFVQRQFRPFFAALVTVAVISAITYVQFGGQVFSDYVAVFRMMSGENGADNLFNLSTAAVSVRMLRTLGLASLENSAILLNKIILAIALASSLLFATRDHWRSDRGSSRGSHQVVWLFGILTIFMTIISPLVWFHHQVFLVIPLFLLATRNLVPGMVSMLLLQAERIFYNVLTVYLGSRLGAPVAVASFTLGIPTIAAEVLLLIMLVRLYFTKQPLTGESP